MWVTAQNKWVLDQNVYKWVLAHNIHNWVSAQHIEFPVTSPPPPPPPACAEKCDPVIGMASGEVLFTMVKPVVINPVQFDHAQEMISSEEWQVKRYRTQNYCTTW